MEPRKGFTLVEILVVISILAMLSSVVLVSVAPARAQARDALRRQQVRQIDLAIQYYKDKYGHAPDLGGSCGAQIAAMTPDAIPGCIAVSTAGVSSPNQAAWLALKSDLAQFMPSIPNDPCGTNCTVVYGNNLGYTYYSPAALQYINQCAPPSRCGSSLGQLNDTYQLSAQLERTNTQAGAPAALPSITISVAPAPGPDGPFILSWVASNASTCSFMVEDKDTSPAWDFYNGWLGPIPPLNFPIGSYTFPSVVPAVFMFTCTGPGGSISKDYNFAGL
jgi:prepilin-type N-terminal cleavage/methylation domain-containing protein